MGTVWMVRAGRKGYVAEDFQKSGCVAIGWLKTTDLSEVGTKELLRELLELRYPEARTGTIISGVTQVGKFLFAMELGDPVVTYDLENREYMVGEISGGYRYDPDLVPDHPQVRPVTWKGEIPRDDLSQSSKNSLGATQTIFTLSEDTWSELSELLAGGEPRGGGPATVDPEADEVAVQLRELEEQSLEFVKDRILKLDWEQMQDLVAGILRGMGYHTNVSPKGGDLGKDVVASPDGLGLEQPRIRAEVKHQSKKQMGAPEVRSFIGALRQSDKGLYVSTGGFSKEARYEAERAIVPVTLIALDELAELLLNHYEDLDIETRTLVPLTKIYWPAG